MMREEERLLTLEDQIDYEAGRFVRVALAIRSGAMGILALDLGTRCGWALMEDGQIESGTQDLTPGRGDSPGMRYVAFNRWLDNIALRAGPGRSEPRVGLIVFEMPHLRGGAAATVLAGLQTRVEEFCAKQTILHAAVHSATLKKYATGKGNADKVDMRAAVNSRWMHDALRPNQDDNEVDAIALLYYGMEKIVGGGAGRDPV